MEKLYSENKIPNPHTFVIKLTDTSSKIPNATFDVLNAEDTKYAIPIKKYIVNCMGPLSFVSFDRQ